MTETLQVHISADRLTLGDLEDLQALGSDPVKLIDWLSRVSGMTREQIRAIPYKQLPGLAEQIRAALNTELTVPNGNGTS